MSDREQNLGEVFADLGRQFGEGLANLGYVAAGQGAMGWMLQGEPEKALQALRDLTDEQVCDVAEVAEKLAELIREDQMKGRS